MDSTESAHSLDSVAIDLVKTAKSNESKESADSRSAMESLKETLATVTAGKGEVEGRLKEALMVLTIPMLTTSLPALLLQTTFLTSLMQQVPITEQQLGLVSPQVHLVILQLVLECRSSVTI